MIWKHFFMQIAHFTVTGENEVGVELVLTQPFLLYYVNHVVLILTTVTYFLKIKFHKNRGQRKLVLQLAIRACCC